MDRVISLLAEDPAAPIAQTTASKLVSAVSAVKGAFELAAASKT